MICIGMIKRFWFIWVIYWLLYLLQPVYSIYQSVELAFLLQFLFVILLSLSYIVGASTLPLRSLSLSMVITQMNQAEVANIIRWGIWISILGLAFIVYDKTVIQGIDYSAGIAKAREQWRVLGEDRDHQVSSPFSVLGYLFGGAFFVSLALTLSRMVLLPDLKRLRYALLAFIILMLNSIATGGRSSILLALAFISFGFFSSRRYDFPPLWRSNRFVPVFLVTAAFGGAYLLYVFFLRAVAINVELADYSLGFLEHLGLEPTPWFTAFTTSSTVGSGLSLINLTISYLTHSLVSTAAIIENSDEGGHAVFVYFISIANKLGSFDAPIDWFLSGRFPSLPGGLYMQFGLSGLVIGALMLGITAGLAAALFARRPDSVVLFFLCASIESILLISPFLFAGDLFFFPFMMIGGGMAIFAGKIFLRYKV
jgi:hypothetical protein